MTTDMLRVSWGFGESGRVSKWFALPSQSSEAQDLIGKLQVAGVGVRAQRVGMDEMRRIMDEEKAEDDANE